jgi:hypothetical protein
MSRQLWVIFGVVVLSAAARADVVEETGPDGKVVARYTVVEGVRSGPYTLFDENGKRKEQGTYLKGKLEGTLSQYDAKGTLIKSGEFRDGRLNGMVREFDGTTPVVEQLYVAGELIYPRSAVIIRRDLAGIRKAEIQTIKQLDRTDTKLVPEHRGKNDSQSDREAAARLLMEYRYLCGVPHDLKLDDLYNAQAEAAVAILSEIGGLDHTPKNPGWPEEEYKFAYEGTSHGNLAATRHGSVRAVQLFMQDSDPKNIARLGHRRWCLNPQMSRVGFAATGSFSVMWAHDSSRQHAPEWQYIAYPAPGLFPTSHFGAKDAWSVCLSGAHFSAPKQGEVKVTVTPVGVDAKKGEINKSAEPLELDYFGVEAEGFGLGNVIIFRPSKLEVKDGAAYRVEIKGLTGASGKEAEMHYVVGFFTPQEPRTMPVQIPAR